MARRSSGGGVNGAPGVHDHQSRDPGGRGLIGGCSGVGVPGQPLLAGLPVGSFQPESAYSPSDTARNQPTLRAILIMVWVMLK